MHVTSCGWFPLEMKCEPPLRALLIVISHIHPHVFVSLQDLEDILLLIQQAGQAEMQALSRTLQDELAVARVKAKTVLTSGESKPKLLNAAFEILPGAIQPRPSDLAAVAKCRIGVGGFGEVIPCVIMCFFALLIIQATHRPLLRALNTLRLVHITAAIL